MPIEEEIEILKNSYKLLKKNGSIHIECRSINDNLFREGEIISLTERIAGHYRRFIDLDELIIRLNSAGFEVINKIESRGLAKFRNEDPIVIRIVAKKI